jgi:hypothetical protein
VLSVRTVSGWGSFTLRYHARIARFEVSPDSNPEDISMVKEVYRVTMGNICWLCCFIQESERIAEVNGQSYVDPSVIQATSRLLLGKGS